MSSSLLALARAIGDLLARRDCAVDDVVAALGVLRSVVFGDRQDSSKIGDIAQLADLCKQRGQGENVLHEPECFGIVAKFLLYKVAPDWIACLTESERSSLFDDFFLAGRPSEVLMALVPALGTEHSLESEFDNVLCIQAERLLIKCFVENPGVRNIAEEFAEAGQPSLQCITQVAQLVSSVPDRVRPKAPASLHSPSFLSSVVSQILSAAKEGWDGSTDSLAKGKFLFIGELFNKLCRRGHADVVAAKFVSELSHFVQTLKTVPKEITCWQGVVLSMKDFYALERMAEAVLYRLNDCYVTEQDAYFTLHSLFGDPLSHASVRNIFTDRFLLWKVFPLRILNCILSFSVLCKHGEEKNIQKDIARSLAESWAEKNYIQSASNDRQAYVTAALGISIKAMTKEEISGTDSLLKFILDGVSRRLDSPFPLIRRMAKQIALVYSIVINPDNPLLLDDEDNIEDLQNWDVPDYSGKKVLADAPEAGNDGIARQVKAKTTVEVDDPDAVVDLANLGGNEESDSESEASLKPYDMSDDEADLDKAKFPSQLSSCAASLRKGDDPDAIERALDVCENFVRLMPDELENSAADLVQALVYVRCSAADDTVEVKRHRALMALLVCAPLTSAGVLTKELYSVHVDMSQRLMILDVLADAAQELANGAEPKEVTRAAGPWKEVSRPLSGDSLLSWGPTYERELPPRPGQEELGKSRRWGKRSLELQVERLKTGGGESCSYRRNRFAPVATAFMLPVMRDYDKKRSGLDIMGTDFIILARLIMMLGVCMQCLSLQPDSPALGAGLIEMLRSRPIFKHPEPYVRRAVLFAASRVLVALSPSHVAALDASLTEGLEWIREWCLEVASHDPDPDCAKMAVACLHIHSEVAFQTSRLLGPSGPPSMFPL
ncbi:telomere length regulation protein TEL2 homolog [Selaginella moellendorffii]|uniref:telomere length regulation protein TEL2 homolog n=1 Tax=Selaginella moellendorffii TaxID=88036 RepID=UPI000D1CB162|nr:telomere length regulation protein TEL2 homolog [Selaginella moellendorffii]|eukprot:XP_024530265.1 telomere length regulation protein TEL2 homolog [Selaginella moellendorffii]